MSYNLYYNISYGTNNLRPSATTGTAWPTHISPQELTNPQKRAQGLGKWLYEAERDSGQSPQQNDSLWSQA